MRLCTTLENLDNIPDGTTRKIINYTAGDGIDITNGVISATGGGSSSDITIVESGSNANGTYVKYSDGRMECYKTVTGTVNITEKYYGYFYQTPNNKYFNLGDYAMPFIERPICSIQFRGGNCQWIGSIQNQSATHAGDLQILSVTSKTAGAYYDVIAFGRWK